ncbi:MAG TPA: penicillin-insensitive murein endopeptidase [Gaiellales bacterium]|nr:penicillin-insensitive murein endopeptidase [Gaiellales bacterium]
MAVAEVRRRRDPGAKELALVERERVRVAPRGGAEIAPPRLLRSVPEPQAVAVVVTRPIRVRPARRPWSDERKRRFQRRFLPAVTALVLAPAPIARVLLGGTGPAVVPLPPVSLGPASLPHLAPLAPPEPSRGGGAAVMPEVVWRDSISLGLPYHGRLIDGVQLPVQSPFWTTWDPGLDRVPDRGYRRYGSAKLIQLLLAVTKEFHDAHPGASRLVIGDISRLGGGPLDEHASHQNGLDVDVYYPRADGRELAPISVDQVNVPLSQDLLNLFLAAKPEFVFVGPHLPLHGPSGVVEPLVGHDNHMHVRIYPPH